MYNVLFILFMEMVRNWYLGMRISIPTGNLVTSDFLGYFYFEGDGKISVVVLFCYIIKEFRECFSRFTTAEQEYLHRLFIQVLVCCLFMLPATSTES